MRIWLINSAENLPIDRPAQRLRRVGIFAHRLAQDGHDVTWWTSRFDHFRKLERKAAERESVAPNLTLELLACAPYASNVSLARIRNHRQLASDFSRRCENRRPPDVILCSLPTIELACNAVRYARRRGIPIAIDVRDLWPDAYLDLVPSWTRALARLALGGLFRASSRACHLATGLVAVNEAFLDWALARAGRPRGQFDTVIQLPFERPTTPEPVDELRAEARWRALGVRFEERFTALFAGTVGRQFDFDAIIASARSLPAELDATFIMCGDGDRIEELRRASADVPRIVWAGWQDAATLAYAMRRSSVGLAPYVRSVNFAGHVPNKPIEYLSFGLPVLSTLTGEVADLLDRRRCGATYASTSQLTEALTRYARDERLRKEHASNAAAAYRELFDTDLLYARLTEYLKRLAASSRRVNLTLPTDGRPAATESSA